MHVYVCMYVIYAGASLSAPFITEDGIKYYRNDSDNIKCTSKVSNQEEHGVQRDCWRANRQ